jgi:hypothetical protein
MKEEDALDFYKRITEGTKGYETVSLEHASGATLEGVEMHPVGKKRLAGVISELPDQMFDAVDDAENAEEAEEQLEENGGSLDAVNENTITAFEKLCADSLSHPDLTNTQIKHIVSELNFEVLFELGTEVINMSSEKTGTIQGFRKQD